MNYANVVNSSVLLVSQLPAIWAVYHIIFIVRYVARLLIMETLPMQDVGRFMVMLMISISTQFQIIGKLCDWYLVQTCKVFLFYFISF